MFPFISNFVTRKDCRDVAKIHADKDKTIARLDVLVNEGHRQRVGHDYEACDDSDDCATCLRENREGCSVDDAEERLRRCARGGCLTADCTYDKATRSLVCGLCGKSEFVCAHKMSVPCVHCS